jgi:hypothetical protein
LDSIILTDLLLRRSEAVKDYKLYNKNNASYIRLPARFYEGNYFIDLADDVMYLTRIDSTDILYTHYLIEEI